MHFDRFDICEAYFVLEMLWNVDGHVPERTRRRVARGGRAESIGVQLSRMHFRPSPSLDLETLTENGREIYDAACARLGLHE